MTEPRNSTPEECEIRQALLSAWSEIFKQHAPTEYADLSGIELRDALKGVFMSIGTVAGIMIAQASDIPADQAWFSQAVSMNIPLGIEFGVRLKRSARAN